MGRQLRVVLLACAALACTPDEFDYGSGGSGKPDCRDDSCETCPAGTEIGPSGGCETICGSWQMNLEMPLPAALAATDSVVVAVGTSGGDDGRPAQAIVQHADACSGQLANAVHPLSDRGSSLSAAATSAGSLFVAGSSDAAVTLAELDVATGATQASYVATELAADSEINDVSVATSGAWVVGSSKTAGPWLVHLAHDTICSGSLTGVANASAVAALEDAALIAAEAGGKLRLVRVAASDCSAPGCACTPSFTSPDLPLPGVDSASVRDLLVIDSAAYLVGHARLGAGEPFGFVISVDVSSGSLGAFAKWDPAAGVDVLNSIAAVGSWLFAAGASGAALPDDATTGAAVVGAWKLPLESDASATWSEALPARRVQALANNTTSLFALADTGAGAAKLFGLAMPVVAE